MQIEPERIGNLKISKKDLDQLKQSYISDSDEEPEYTYDEEGHVICGVNAYFNITKKECDCKPGFSLGNPYKQKGCYYCKVQCSKHAQCEYPGECKCPSTHFGNGSICIQNLPKIQLITQINTTHIQVDINYMSDDSLDHGFCSVNGFTSKATHVTDKYFVCKVKKFKQTLDVKLSKDGKDWSKMAAYHSQISDDNSGVASRLIMILVFLCIMVILVLVLSRATPPKKEEIQPFINPKDRKNSNINAKDTEFAKV